MKTSKINIRPKIVIQVVVLEIHKVITSYNFKMTKQDHYIYIMKSNDKFAILSFYINDVLVVENDLEYIMTMK